MTVLGVIGYGRATDPCLSRVGPKSELADRSTSGTVECSRQPVRQRDVVALRKLCRCVACPTATSPSRKVNTSLTNPPSWFR